MIGRRESPVDPSAGPIPRFAFELRGLRDRAGRPSYREMVARAGYSIAALSQAAAGARLPSLELTLGYVQACGGDAQEWKRRWHEASAEEAAQLRVDDEVLPPYRGLARFEPGDSALFFGRDELTDQLVDLARDHRFMGVFGPSGSGKSSLLRAGLVPRLRHTEDRDLRPAAVRILTPGGRPLHTHHERLIPRSTDGTDSDTWLIVDQFEELYTLCSDPAERTAFIDRLLTALDPGSRLRVLIAVRADFLTRCTENSRLTDALQGATLLAGQMSREGLRKAIVNPARAGGVTVQRSLTDRVLTEVEGEPGALPLMSHALLETWRYRRGRTLTESAYDTAGGLRGAIARTAEGVYGQLTDAQADLARRILLRLITPGDNTADTRRPTDRAELDLGDPQDTTAVLESLVRARLLTLDDGTIDLAHEALITAWPRLRDWIEADRERLRTQRRLTEAARAWHDLDRDAGALYRGSRLTAAEDAFPASDRHHELTFQEREFLAASARQRHRGRALRRTVAAVLTSLALLASTAAVVAFQQRSTARAERNAAVFQQLTARADTLRENQPSLAAQLDLAAYQRHRTPDLATRLETAAGGYLSSALTGHKEIVYSVAFSPDGRTLASTGLDGTLRLWDAEWPADAGSAALSRTPTGHAGSVAALAFSPDKRTLATAGDDGSVRLWDVSDPARPRTVGKPLTGHSGSVSSVAFSPDGGILAVGVEDGSLRLRDVTDPARPKNVGELPSAHDSFITSLAFSPDGRTLASAGGDDRTARLWDIADPARPTAGSRPLPHSAAVWTLAFSPDGRTLATAGYDNVAHLWDVTGPAGPKALGGPLTGHTSAIWSLAFHPDGHTLATTGEDDTVRLWNIKDLNRPLPLGKPLTDHTHGVRSVVFAPDGRTLASAGNDRAVRVWHRPGTLLTDSTTPVNAVAFSPGGNVLAAASSTDNPDDDSGEYVIRLWNTENPARPVRLGQLLGHTDKITSLAFAPDGRILATGGTDRTVRLWNLTDPSHPAPLGEPLTGHGDSVSTVAFAPDGRTLASGSHDTTVRLWDLADRKRPALLGELRTDDDWDVNSVAFSPDGRTLAAGSENTHIWLWDLSDRGRPEQLGEPLYKQDGVVTSVAFSPDSRVLATGSADRSVQLWDLKNRSRPVLLGEPLTGPTESVISLAFSPDGRTLATGSEDTTVWLWNMTDPAHPVPWGQPLTGHTNTVHSVAFRPDGPEGARTTGGRTLVSAGYDATVRLWRLDPDSAAQRVCATTRGTLTKRQWETHVPGTPYEPPCP